MGRLRVFAATTFFFVAANAFAARTDVIVLRNGDRLTGEVKQLSRGQLKVTTDDVGTIYIEWDKIASVTTAGRYEVATESGARHVGSLAPDTPGTLQVIADDGAVTRLAFLDVVSVASIKSGFFERIDGSLDVGGNYTKSSGVGQLSILLDLAYRRPSYDVFTDFESNLTRQRESPSIARFTLMSGYTHFRDDRWIMRPFIFMERNPDLGLTLRSVAALALGRYLQQSSRSATLLLGGAAAGRERSVTGETTPNVDALVSFATSFYRYDYPRRSVDLSVMVFPELNRWGRVRVHAQARVNRELFRDLITALSLYDTYDSRPLESDVSRNDIGATLSIGWTF